MPESSDALARRIKAHVTALCSVGPDRSPGTEANARAVREVAAVMHDLGLEVEVLPFETVGWDCGSARIERAGGTVGLQPGPYSLPVATSEVGLLAASTVEELAGLDARGAALLLYGGIAAEQLTPRGYPFYENPPHAAILDAIEATEPVAVIAATGKDPGATAALSPFPLIEDGVFPLPSAYLAETDVAPLLEDARSGSHVTLTIDSGRFTASGEQVVGRLGASVNARRIIVCAHIDTKHGTPGALDNASGVATMLAAAELLAADPPEGFVVEFVPFNGEDHYAAPGELAFLAAHPPDGDIALVVNIDGAGLAGGPSAVSTYGVGAGVDAAVTDLIASHRGVEPGEPWFASDHAVFAMGGTPAVAITSAELGRIMEHIAHTPADTPDLVDPDVLSDTARFIAALVRSI